MAFPEENVSCHPNFIEFPGRITQSEQGFHHEKRLIASDGKHEGKEIQRGNQTRRSISLRTVFCQEDPALQNLAKQTSFFIPDSRQSFLKTIGSKFKQTLSSNTILKKMRICLNAAQKNTIPAAN